MEQPKRKSMILTIPRWGSERELQPIDKSRATDKSIDKKLPTDKPQLVDKPQLTNKSQPADKSRQVSTASAPKGENKQPDSSRAKRSSERATDNQPERSPAPRPEPSDLPKPSDIQSKPASKQPDISKSEQPAAQKSDREYTVDEISKLTSEGYIVVHPALWDHIPIGSHVRYVKKDTGDNKPRGQRFKPGGFVKNHRLDENSKKILTLESCQHTTARRRPPGYYSLSIAYDSIEMLWKKYDRMSFVEMHLIYNSLAQKKQQIEELTVRIAQLEAVITRLTGEKPLRK